MSNIIQKIQPDKNESVLNKLRNEGYAISADCGGKGNCGKCKVQVLIGNAPISTEDEKIFTEDELREGWRLSCTLYAEDEIDLAFTQNNEAEFEVITEHENTKMQIFSSVEDNNRNSNYVSNNNDSVDSKAAYNIAIDIGTTTIAFQLIDMESGKILHTVTSVNQQRRYGADVVSRIQASISGKKAALQASIRKDLKTGILSFVRECQISLKQIKNIVIAANTTMGHILMGYDCTGLGSYPFKPANIDTITGTAKDILGMQACNADVTLLPGISAYVGGDILSGLYACDFYKNDEICLFIDLGTNGEMALGNKDKILVASTSAGPAFEGGNIIWGMGSVPGAICSVNIKGQEIQVCTIGDKLPKGICGTGVVEAVAELLRENRMDTTGLLQPEYFEEGFPLAETSDGESILLTQKDIREFQMAKSAIRAGVETLLLRYGISEGQVAKIYLAGGFGCRLDTGKAIAVGMLSRGFADRIEAIGNSSLAGAVKYLNNVDMQDRDILRRLKNNAEEVNLSNDEIFGEYFLKFMQF